MFDPHRTRRSDYRYYTRKGQVLQASRVNVNPVIDQRLVPIYKNYLLKNNLVNSTPQPPPPTPPPPQPQNSIKPIGIAVNYNSTSTITYYPFTEFTYDTRISFTIAASPLSEYNALMIFQQMNDQSFRFLTTVFTGSYSYSITKNYKCYYKVISITDISDYLNSPKALYHTSPTPGNIFLSIDLDIGASSQNLSIFPPTPVKL